MINDISCIPLSVWVSRFTTPLQCLIIASLVLLYPNAFATSLSQNHTSPFSLIEYLNPANSVKQNFNRHDIQIIFAVKYVANLRNHSSEMLSAPTIIPITEPAVAALQSVSNPFSTVMQTVLP